MMSLINIEITGATKEQLQQVYDRLNNTSFDGIDYEVDCEWTQEIDCEVVSIAIDSKTISHADFLLFTELLDTLNVKWDEIEIGDEE